MSRRTKMLATVMSTLCVLAMLWMPIGAAVGSTLPPELKGDPCSKNSSIKLPSSNQCLVLVSEPMSWVRAAAACDDAGGILFTTPSARLYSRPRLMDCLASTDGSGFNDLWMNGVSVWLSQFMWTNGTVMNKVSYCPTEEPQTKKSPITSDTLSVDYCVSTCHDQGARFVMLYSTGASPRCNCIFDLEPKYMVKCNTQFFLSHDHSRYFIVHSEENALIKVGSADAFSSTEIMCATVDHSTATVREMKSETCFTQRPFICELGTAKECKEAKKELKCMGTECLFTCNNKCLKRVSYRYNWYAAKSFCSSLGGDLWNMEEFDDMKQVAQFLDGQSRYWIGATNYIWNFNATQRALDNTDRTRTRCGHMFREMTSGAISRRWSWSDADCGQNKSFVCQFADRQFSRSQQGLNVSCPWPIIYTGGVTSGPVVPVGPTQATRAKSDDSFPVAAVIAGIISGIILLTCLGLALAFCGRRHWHKVREHLTFIPYFSDNSHVVMGNSHDFESMSQVGHSRSHMSSVSEHGSQIGLVKGGYSSYGMASASHAEAGGMFSSKSLDRRHMESMGHKLADSQHYLASANNSMDERGFAATYSTMPSKQKEYMTLQAHMDIQDDAQLEAMRRSLRGKPEMTLVTDNVDMNLTVNHASGTLGNGVASGSGSVTERVMEEVTLPASEGGVILTFPERVQEAHIFSSSGSSTTQHRLI